MRFSSVRNLRRKFSYNLVALAAVAWITAGCGNPATTEESAASIPYVSSGSAYPYSTTLGANGLPTNIFSSSTLGDLTPITGTTSAALAGTYSASCLTSNSGLLGNLGTSLTPIGSSSTTGISSSSPYCYNSSSALTSSALFQSGLTGYSTLSQVYTLALQMDPGPGASAAVIQSALQTAEMGIIRAARMQLWSSAQLTQWSPYQTQAFSSMDNTFYTLLTGLSQSPTYNYPSSYSPFSSLPALTGYSY